MKIDRHGRAKILTNAEIELLFKRGFVIAIFQSYWKKKSVKLDIVHNQFGRD